MPTAGGRLFVDMTDNLATPTGRHMILNVLGKSDPLIRDALTTIVEREILYLSFRKKTRIRRKLCRLRIFKHYALRSGGSS